jgi:hypothetical protein
VSRPCIRQADRLPWAPLARQLQVQADEPDPLPPSRVALLLDVPPRYIHRWRHEGLPWARADELAVGLGLHPGEVWPEWWEDPCW